MTQRLNTNEQNHIIRKVTLWLHGLNEDENPSPARIINKVFDIINNELSEVLI